jgi:hypothetical protein
LILHYQNLTRNYQSSWYIKQCDCIDTTANDQAQMSLMLKSKNKPTFLAKKQRLSIFQPLLD